MHVSPTGQMWGRRPTWYAKVGTMSGSVIVVYQPKEFHVGQRILFAELHKLKGTSKRMTPRWESGQIYKIEDSRLFIELL